MNTILHNSQLFGQGDKIIHELFSSEPDIFVLFFLTREDLRLSTRSRKGNVPNRQNVLLGLGE